MLQRLTRPRHRTRAQCSPSLAHPQPMPLKLLRPCTQGRHQASDNLDPTARLRPRLLQQQQPPPPPCPARRASDRSMTDTPATASHHRRRRMPRVLSTAPRLSSRRLSSNNSNSSSSSNEGTTPPTTPLYRKATLALRLCRRDLSRCLPSSNNSMSSSRSNSSCTSRPLRHPCTRPRRRSRPLLYSRHRQREGSALHRCSASLFPWLQMQALASVLGWTTSISWLCWVRVISERSCWPRRSVRASSMPSRC